MLEEAIPSIWASVYSFFTPTVLFVLLNVVIGTIAVTSKGIRSPHHHDGVGEGKLGRTSSAVLERIRSFNLYRHIPAEHPLETAPHHHDGEGEGKLGRTSSAVLERLRSFNLYRHIPAEHPLETAPPPPARSSTETLEIPPPSEPAEHHQFSRSQSDAQPTAGEMPQKLAGKMKKSASSQSAFAHFEESDIVRRSPAPEPEPEEEEEEEVDARANDFINRFRQQLKLQRLDSLKRYREMLQRGR